MKTKLLMLLVLSTLANGVTATELIGEGRKVPVPVFNVYNEMYHKQHPDVKITYRVTDEIQGVKDVETGKADFSEANLPLDKAELDKRGLYQFPYMFSAATPILNIPNAPQIRLSGQVLADILMGKITKWNDPRIVEVNIVTLRRSNFVFPDEKIIFIYSANKGLDQNITSYLSQMSPEFKAKIGKTVTPKWTIGTSAEDLNKVADAVQKTPFSISYLNMVIASQRHLNTIKLDNSSGDFVSANPGSVLAAIEPIKWTASNGFKEELINRPGVDAWPITGVSYMFIRKSSDNVVQRNTLLKYIGWSLRVGSYMPLGLNFMPLPLDFIKVVQPNLNDTPTVLAGAHTVDLTQVQTLQKSGAVLLDARTSDEYKTSHVPGAISLPYAENSVERADYSEIDDRMDLSKLPKNKADSVVFYCDAAPCWKGYKAANMALKAGYKNVSWFRGQ